MGYWPCHSQILHLLHLVVFSGTKDMLQFLLNGSGKGSLLPQPGSVDLMLGPPPGFKDFVFALPPWFKDAELTCLYSHHAKLPPGPNSMYFNLCVGRPNERFWGWSSWTSNGAPEGRLFAGGGSMDLISHVDTFPVSCQWFSPAPSLLSWFVSLFKVSFFT